VGQKTFYLPGLDKRESRRETRPKGFGNVQEDVMEIAGVAMKAMQGLKQGKQSQGGNSMNPAAMLGQMIGGLC
jgi:hypothetical protein